MVYPIAPSFNDETDLTIAVNLGGEIEHKQIITREKESKSEKNSTLTDKINEFVESLKDSTITNISHEWGAYDVANQAFDAMQSTIARQKLAAYPPDHFIKIARNACGTLEFDRATEMIELGYKKAQESLGEKS